MCCCSSPVTRTKKDSIVDTISAMEFCFIYGKCPVFDLLPLISAVMRAFFLLENDKSVKLSFSNTFDFFIILLANIEKSLYNIVSGETLVVRW